MKVIFLEDVPNVARAGEIKEVANGYGRNYLIPSKLALLATADTINSMSAKLEALTRSRAQTEAEMVEMANHLDGREILLEAPSGGKERLYGSITSVDIATELENATGLAIDKRKIELEESIRKTGTYEVSIRLAKDIVPKIKVTVTGKSAENE
ncbi:50S ribosomal protein L9 [Chloroflexota bacterium]